MPIREYVLKNQPILSKTFVTALENKRLSHAYLLLGEPGIPLKEVAFYLAKSILCDSPNPLADETCLTCKRIENNDYPDLIFYNGEENSIKKEDVSFISSSFSKTPLEEKGIMIYIIHQVENMTGEASNSLLKFLEEPSPNTYAILTSQNEARILPTIISRCETIRLLLKPKEEVKLDAINNGVSTIDAELLSPFYNDASLIEQISKDEDYLKAKDAFLSTLDALANDSSYARYILEKSVMPVITTKPNARKFFDFLSCAIEDAVSIKNNEKITLESLKGTISQINNSIPSLEDALLNTLTLRGEIESNINLGLLLAHLITLICKETTHE